MLNRIHTIGHSTRIEGDRVTYPPEQGSIF
jgi:hypothetical protein